mmetsp:Transcript_8606/g.1187  ORF Transcript_8606/g.1187 Transcript_8606/m.1187 type:complete len:107 (+) Transcript_8606:599-919(+)
MHIWNVTKENEEDTGYLAFLKGLESTGITLFIALGSFGFMFFVYGLMIYHIYINCKGNTTREYIKKDFKHSAVNPYKDKNCIVRCFQRILLGKPQLHYSLKAQVSM